MPSNCNLQFLSGKQGSFLGNLGREIGSPFARLGANVALTKNLAESLFTGPQGKDAQEAEQIRTKGLDLPFFGNVKPVGVAGQGKGLKGFGQDVKDTLGVGTEIASLATPIKGVPSLFGKFAKGKIGQAVGQGATVAGVSGAGFGAGREAQDPESTFGSIGTQGLISGAISVPLGGAFSGLGAAPIASRLGIAKKAAQTPTSRLQEMTGTLSTLQNSLERNTRFNKGTRNVRSTPIETLRKENLVPTVSDGKVQTIAIRESLNEGIAKTSNEVTTLLKSVKGSVPLAQYQKIMIDSIRNDKLLQNLGMTAKVEKQAQDILENYASTYGNKIPYVVINDIRKAANTQWKNAEVRDVYRVIGDASREIVYDAVPDKAVRSLLLKESDLIGAREFSRVLQGKAVKGGRLGGYMASLIGAISGTTIGGPLGGIIGAAAGKSLQSASQRAFFNPPLGRAARVFDKVLPKLNLKSSSTPTIKLGGRKVSQRLSPLPKTKPSLNLKSKGAISLTKTPPKLKPVKPSLKKPASKLEVEARKFNTAKEAISKGLTEEQYVKGQGTPVFRGAKTSELKATSGDVGTGFYFAENKGVAKTYAGETFDENLGKWVDKNPVHEYVISPKTKIVDEKNMPNGVDRQKWATENNYDGVRYKQGATSDSVFNKETNLIIYNKDVIKTTSQLRAEYRAAKGGKTNLLEEAKKYKFNKANSK